MSDLSPESRARMEKARKAAYRLRVKWYAVGLLWTERQCRRHGGDYYSGGYSWLLRKLGWD